MKKVMKGRGRKVLALLMALAMVVTTVGVHNFIKPKKVWADTEKIYDSASAINFETILGGGVDYGIVADSITQKSHMETTYATNFFTNNAGNNDIDFVHDKTAHFIVGGLGDGSIAHQLDFGLTYASAFYIEGVPSVFAGFNGKAQNDGNENSNFNFRGDFPTGDFPIIQAENANASANVNRLIEKISNSGEWSDFLSGRATNESSVLDSSYLNYNSSGFLDINIDDPMFEGKVVYINADAQLLNAFRMTDGIKIYKDSSTVVVFNIEDSVVDSVYGSDTFETNKYTVYTNGEIIHSNSATNGGTGTWDGSTVNYTGVDSEVCQKIIWNIRTNNNVSMNNMAGTILCPYSDDVSLDGGNVSGWLVAKGHVDVNVEFHYLYSDGSEEDDNGQMHFALNKLFTKEYADKDSVVQDTTVSVEDKDFGFIFKEYDEGYNSEIRTYDESFVKTSGKVKFPVLKFHTSADELTDEEKAIADDYHVIEVPTADNYNDGSSTIKEEVYNEETQETEIIVTTKYYNAKEFYFKITEDQSKTVDGISNSKGEINITLKVRVDDSGNFSYYVTSETTTGDNGEIQYATNDNVAMSGVQFDLGAFYNKSSDVIELRKSVTGDYEANDEDTFAFTVKGADGNYYDKDGNASEEPVYVYVKAGEKVKVANLSQQKYTVSEVDIEGYEVDRAGFKHDDVDDKEVTLDGKGTKSVTITNNYTASGVLEVTKNVTGNFESAKSDVYSFYVTNTDGEYLQSETGGIFNTTQRVFTITNGEKVRLVNIPTGTYYVTEVDASADDPVVWTLTYNVDGNEIKNSTSAEVLIDGSDTDAVEVEINNDYHDESAAKITITKEVKGVNSQAAWTNTYQVNLYYLDGENKVYINSNGSVADWDKNITVEAGKSVEIEGSAIVADRTYYVEEVGQTVGESTTQDLDPWQVVTLSKIEYSEDSVTPTVEEPHKEVVVTNTYGEIDDNKTEISVKKVWVDKEDQDGLRPAEVVVNLLANGEETGDVLTLSENNEWKDSFKDLPIKDDEDKDIVYTIDEVVIGDDYTTEVTGDAETGFIITNTHEVEKTAIVVRKVWDDANNQDGKRPDSVTVNLLANGVPTGISESLNESNHWRATINNLDANKNGQPITYSFTEDAVSNYSTVIEEDDEAANTIVVTNSYTPGKTSVSVTKTWDDSDNQDGKRPEEVTVRLLADGEATGDVATLSANNNWTYTFTELDENKNKQKVVYTVTEDDVDGYTAVVSGDAKEGYVITNKHDVETTEVSVNKVWDDSNNADGSRTESVTIKLFADDEDTDLTLTLSEANNWTGKFENLDKYNNGEEIVYTIQEVEVPDYTTEITGNAADGFTVTNSHDAVIVDDVGNLKITKSFDGANVTEEEAKGALTFTVALLDADGGVVGYLDKDGVLHDDEQILTLNDGFESETVDGKLVFTKTFTGIDLGKYKVTEVNTAIEGYVFDSEASSTEREVTVVKAEAGTADAEAEILDVYDYVRSELVIEKTLAKENITDSDLTHLLFTVQASEDNKEYAEKYLYINDNGKVEYSKDPVQIPLEKFTYDNGKYSLTFEDIVTGSYKVTEVQTEIEGYSLTKVEFNGEDVTNDDEWSTTVTLGEDKETVSITDEYINDAAFGNLIITKTVDGENITKEEAEGALQFTVSTVFKIDGEDVTFYLNKDGEFKDTKQIITLQDGFECEEVDGILVFTKKFTRIPALEYTVTETNTEIEGYMFISKESTTTGTATVTSTEDKTVALEDKYVVKEGSSILKFTKVNESNPNQVLEGSTYGLFENEDAEEPIDTCTSDHNGVVEFENVELDKEYVIRELEAPDGYYVSREPITVKLTQDEETGKVVLVLVDDGDGTAELDENGNLTWLEPVVVVEVSKVDEEGNPVSGAKLHIEDENGKTVYEFTTTEKAEVITGELLCGHTYTLVEDEPPKGYQKANPQSFEISETAGPAENIVVTVSMIDKAEETTQDVDDETTTKNEDTTSDLDIETESEEDTEDEEDEDDEDEDDEDDEDIEDDEEDSEEDSEDSSVTGGDEVITPAQTSDNFNVTAFLLIFMLSLAGIVGGLIIKKREE